jgi:hypothetical protein
MAYSVHDRPGSKGGLNPELFCGAVPSPTRGHLLMPQPGSDRETDRRANRKAVFHVARPAFASDPFGHGIRPNW